MGIIAPSTQVEERSEVINVLNGWKTEERNDFCMDGVEWLVKIMDTV